MVDLEQRARELLAGIVEQVCDPQHAANIAKNIRENGVRAGVPSHVVIPAIVAALRQQPAPVVDDSMRKDAERYRWLRNPTSDVGLVIDKVTGEVPYHEGTHTGGYATYEYRAGDELDSAIDAALARAQGVGNG